MNDSPPNIRFSSTPGCPPSAGLQGMKLRAPINYGQPARPRGTLSHGMGMDGAIVRKPIHGRVRLVVGPPIALSARGLNPEKKCHGADLTVAGQARTDQTLQRKVEPAPSRLVLIQQLA